MPKLAPRQQGLLAIRLANEHISRQIRRGIFLHSIRLLVLHGASHGLYEPEEHSVGFIVNTVYLGENLLVQVPESSCQMQKVTRFPKRSSSNAEKVQKLGVGVSRSPLHDVRCG